MTAPKRRMPAEQRRRLILRGAVRVFAKSNYRAAKVADIAAAAGVSEAMIYKHFASKKEIFLEILEHMSGRIMTFWREEMAAEPEALKCLRNMGTTYFQRMIKHPDELQVQFQAVSEINDRDIARRLHADHEGYMSLIRQVIDRGKAQGSIRHDLSTEVLVLFWNSGGILMNMMKVLSFDQLDETLVRQLLDHMLDSMSV